MKEVAIYHHLGVGDTFECSPIVRINCQMYDLVYTFCKKKNFNLTKDLYKDLKNLKIIEISNNENFERADVDSFFQKNPSIEKLIVGHEKYFSNLILYNQISCTEAFYKIAGIPYDLKYEEFYYQRNIEEEERIYKKLNPNNEKYIFIHDDKERNFNINVNTQLKIIKNDTTENMLHMIKILENAEEIHCMSSSFLCLIDCLIKQIDFKKLVLHYNTRNVFLSSNSIDKKWIIQK